MTNPYGFRVGPPDDAKTPAMMKVGLTAKKAAIKHYRQIAPIVLDFEPSAKPTEVLDYQWQGMISLAAYALTLTDHMFKSMGWVWQNEGKETPHSLEVLMDQTYELSKLFSEQIRDNKETK